jgi:dihydrofolate reductase
VFIATSVDGFIARRNGDLEWLTSRGEASGDSGYDDRIRVVRTLADAVAFLNQAGASHVYIDGGTVVQSCLAAGLIDDPVITRVPILLGDGIPLFGALPADIEIETLSVGEIGGGLIQERYAVAR